MAMKEDLNDLTAFLDDVDGTLSNVVLGVLPRFGFYEGQKLQDSTVAAWEETQRFLGDARGQLRSAQPGDEIANGLEGVGLSGRLLEWKLGNFRNALSELKNRVGGFEWPGIRPILKKVLGWMNTILGSLAKVITMLDPVKEFKEGIEHLLPEADEPVADGS